MIPKECKRLAEVDFPIAEVSKHAAREKSIRHGHPSTLHLWWARRPLASCRAMLLALLLPDPCDANCPVQFKETARVILGSMVAIPEGEVGLRNSLLKFIGDVSNWDVANNQRWVGVARGLVKAAYPEDMPLIIDPFAGGGSIPLEALRLGCDTFASDLNPVACLILKVMLEDIPRNGVKLADELRRAGKQTKERAEEELKEFYPKEPDGSTPIAYLWARTVRCEEPGCGANIPLLRTGWLVARKNKAGNYKELLSLDLSGDTLSKTLSSQLTRHQVPVRALPDKGHGTIKNGKATCLCCKHTMSAARVNAQLIQQNGGSDVVVKCGALGAVVVDSHGVSRIGVFPTQKVNPLGSGDVFSGVFSYYWAERGISASEAARLASKATAAWVSNEPFQVVSKDGNVVWREGGDELYAESVSVYLAAPFFTIAERWLVDLCRTALKDLGAKVFSPLHDVGWGPPEFVAPADLEGLRQSDSVLALLDGLDSGTVYEVGHAVALGIPVVGIVSDQRGVDLTMITGNGSRIYGEPSSAVYDAIWQGILYSQSRAVRKV